MKNKKIVGIFSSETEAIRVIENLKTAGYEDNEISVVAKDRDKLDRIDELTDVDTDSNAFSDTSKAAGGAVVGGAIGGAGALLLELGVFAIPGVGPFLAAGPIAATLAGLVAGGAVGGAVGGIVDVLVDSGIDQEDAEEYKTYIDRGDILVAVDEKVDLDRDRVIRYYSDSNSVIKDRYNNY